MPPPPKASITGSFSLPTILVAIDDEGVRNSLLKDLHREGYFVLLADGESEALVVVRVHSRAIHLLLAPESIDGRTLAATLRQYRPKMHALFISRFSEDVGQDLIRVESALPRVREMLERAQLGDDFMPLPVSPAQAKVRSGVA